MKAVVYTEYGSPDVLKLTEIEPPVPRDNEVLIKVHAASVNSWDWDRLTGKPKLYRLIHGLSKPRLKILGADVAGTVEQIGRNVKHLSKGNEVFGDLSAGNWGSFAEYVCAKESSVTIKPEGMSFEQAAGIPQAGIIALQGIRDSGKLKAGQKVLINGAGGGVGTFALQLAKYYGSEVTAVDKNEKLYKLRSLGADHVVDYKIQEYTESGQKYDLIVDVVAQRSVFKYKRILNPGGRFIVIGGKPSSILQAAFIGPLISVFSKKKLGILAHKPNKDLNFLIELFESGKLVPVIHKVFGLKEVPEAMRMIGEGKVFGKLIITLHDLN